MTLHIGPVEALWIAVNAVNLTLTLLAILANWHARSAIKHANGHAREIAANANVRREILRALAQFLLLVLVIPEALIDREIRLTPAALVLIAVSFLLLANTLADGRVRRQILGLAEEAIEAERLAAIAKAQQARAAEFALLEAQNVDMAAHLEHNTDLLRDANATIAASPDLPTPENPAPAPAHHHDEATVHDPEPAS